MAFNAATQWEFQTTGDNTNGGGFFDATPGTSVDLALANTPVTFTDLVIDAATNTKITSATRPFTTADAGNVINITSGTGFTVQRVQVTAVDGSAIATCDKAVGTVGSTGGNGKMGGALAVPTDALLELLDDGMTAWIKSGTYTLTADVQVFASGTAVNPIKYRGYQTARGDSPTGSNRPTIARGGYDFSSGDYSRFDSIIFIGTSGLFSSKTNNGGVWVNCKAVNTTSTSNRVALQANGSNTAISRVINCEAECTNGYALYLGDYGFALNNFAHSSLNGIYCGGVNQVIGNIVRGCTNAIQLGSSDGKLILGNTIYGDASPAGVGISGSTSDGDTIIQNNICNLAKGIEITTTYGNQVVDYNNVYNCTTPYTGVTAGPNDIALDPAFVDAANGDFTPGSNMKLDIDWTEMGL